MSLFGSLMGDFEDDPIFGQHMRSMRQMNTMMNSMFADPFGSFDVMNGGLSALTGGFGRQHPMAMGNALMPFGMMPPMPNMNRLLSMDGGDGTSFSSSRVISMSHGPDGRPQVYQATSSTKTGPGGIRETQKTVQDSRSGVKKMAIGHHIGERGHIIEREQNLHSGQQEERQDFINLEEDDAEEFDREFTRKSRQGRMANRISEIDSGSRRNIPAIMPAQNNPSSETSINTNDLTTTSSSTDESQPQITMPSESAKSVSSSPAATITSPTNMRRGLRNQIPTPRRPLRTPTSSPLTMSSGFDIITPRSSIHSHPYNVSPSTRRSQHRPMKGSHHSAQANQHHHVQIEELPDDYDETAATNNTSGDQRRK